MSLTKIHTRMFMAGFDARADVRGPFGYGRPAHGSDPRATYVFGFPDGLAPKHAGESPGESADAMLNGEGER